MRDTILDAIISLFKKKSNHNGALASKPCLYIISLFKKKSNHNAGVFEGMI